MTTWERIKQYARWWLSEAKTGWNEAEAQAMEDLNPFTITLAILLFIAEAYLVWRYLLPVLRIPPVIVSFFHRV